GIGEAGEQPAGVPASEEAPAEEPAPAEVPAAADTPAATPEPEPAPEPETAPAPAPAPRIPAAAADDLHPASETPKGADPRRQAGEPSDEEVEAFFAEPSPEKTGDQLLSPVVRRLVREHQVDLSRVKGTGEGGRITRKDVEAYLETRDAAPAAAPAAEPAA